MKLKNILHHVLMIVILSSLGLNACKKFVTIPPAPNLINSTQVFADSTDANSAVLGMYINMASSSYTPYNSEIVIYTGLSSDELSTTNSYVSADQSAMYANAIEPLNGSIYGLYASFYESYIYPANAIIEGLTASKTVSVAAKNQFIGEAKVVRAMAYFDLINLFGSVPLVTTTNFKVSESIPRTPVSTVYDQITSDLKDAQTLLSVNYPTSGRERPNRYTATALLAKVYLYQKDWVDAAIQASSVINCGLYSLESNLNSVFLAGSNEAIWQLQPSQAGYETGMGSSFVPYSNAVVPNYVLSNYLLSAFEAGDQRKSNWTNSNTISGVTYYYPYKYKLAYDGNTTPVENIMICRLAEQYLIRAEAVAEGAPGSAIADLNIVRERAGLPPYAGATDPTSILTAIIHENQVEFFTEGHRWYDLKRTNVVNSVMGTPGNVCQAKGGVWNPNWALYPIPMDEIQSNPSLTQNPGY
jgi:hypothetical protein